MSEAYEQVLPKVTKLVAYYGSKRADELSENTRLWEDAGITGDDAWDFLEAFAEEFAVDMSGFEYSQFFWPEHALHPFGHLLYVLNSIISKKPRHKTRSITVKDLTEIAQRKKWNY